MTIHADNVREVMIRSWTIALALFAAMPSFAAEGEWVHNDQSALRLITPYEIAAPQGEFWFGVEFELAPEWHVYWKNGGDAGYPPELDLAMTPEIQGAKLLFPAPHLYHLPGGLVAIGYEHRVVYPVRAKIAAEGEELSLKANVDYVVCASECIPYRYDLELTQPLGPEARESAAAVDFANWRSQVPQDGPTLTGGLESNSNTDGSLTFELPFAVSELFFAAHDDLELAETVLERKGEATVARVAVSRLSVQEPLAENVELEWTAIGQEPSSPAGSAWTGLVATATPATWSQTEEESASIADGKATAAMLWWYWLPVVAAAALYLASGAVTTAANVLRPAWVGGVAAAGITWFALTKIASLAQLSTPVVSVGACLLVIFAAFLFAGHRVRNGWLLLALAACAAFAALPSAPGVGWFGLALLVLAVVVARPQADAVSPVALGAAGFFALAAVIARFYVLTGSLPPTPLAGVQVALLPAGAGGWLLGSTDRSGPRMAGWLLVAAGIAGVLYFVR